jgi:competence protein ComEC
VVLSGYNVMIVAGSILKVSSRLPRLFGLSIAALAIVLFVIAAGANSSAIRAGIMAILSLLAQGMYRKYDVLRALIASLVLMVLINPLLLVYDPGLQLSFLATMGLILGSQPIQMHLLWMRSAFFEEAVATTLSAQVAVLPFLLYESGNLSLVALPANIAVMPVVPIAMAASALSAVVSFVLPFLGPLAGLPAYICLWYIVEVAKVSARLPFAQFIVPAFSAWWMFGAYALLMFAVIKMRSLHHFA